ncbi:FHA domain-containing protein [Chloroflexota bacterium]
MAYSEVLGPELVIEHTGQVFSLTQEPVTIGREVDNAIILADPEVSAYHATIYWQAGINAYAIEDTGSTNGTFVNERLVEGSQILRHGDVIRVGNTVMDLKFESAAAAGLAVAGGVPPVVEEESSESPSQSLLLPIAVIVLLAGITLACLALVFVALLGGRADGLPTVAIQSPADGAQIVAGQETVLQAGASGTNDITLLELSVDGNLVATATSADPKGVSTLTVSKPWTFDLPGEHTVSAVAYTAKGKTSKPESVDVTVVSSGGELQPTATPTPLPELTATPTPTPEPGAPQIEFFEANPSSIDAGQCTTLRWGKVSDATEAHVEPDVGGVATPDSATVCPLETTTYVLTAKGPGGTSSASTTVTVSTVLADLTVDSISFDPNPPVRGQDTGVRIAIRNAGAGAAGAFDWEWQAGSEALFDGRLAGLNPGETSVVTVRWTPADAYASLSTEARVDTKNEVPETDKTNNRLVAVVQVVEDAGGPGSVTVESDASLDGYRANNSSGSRRHDILVGNGDIVDPTGELVWRGFMSFDLSSIPSGADITNVELRFFQAKVGGDPYGKLGNLVLEHVDYGSSLDASAYDTAAMDSAMLAQQPNPGAWYILSDPTLADWVGKDLAAGRSRFQLRLRFAQETDGDGEEDYTGIESADNFFGTGNIPVVIVSYGP